MSDVILTKVLDELEDKPAEQAAEVVRFPRHGLMQRAMNQREELGKLENLLQGFLNKVKGPPPAPPENAVLTGTVATGMPAIFDLTERRIKTCMKLASDLNEMF